MQKNLHKNADLVFFAAYYAFNSCRAQLLS